MCTIHVFAGDFATKKRHTKQIITDYLGNMTVHLPSCLTKTMMFFFVCNALNYAI
jgi:hypothetical protein